MKFDDRALQRAFAQYIDYSNRSVPEILEKQIVQLAVGAKGVKGLFQEALSTRKDTVREIKSLPARLGWRIKRVRGSARAEIARRVAKAGYYQASGWVIPGLAEPRGRGARVITQRGEIRTSGRGKISISNKSPKALEFAERTGYMQRAVDARAKDMLRYCEQKMASEAKEFSKKSPSFTKSIDEQLAELVRR